MMRRVDGVWAVLLACSEFDDPWHAIAAKCARAPTHWCCNGAPAKCDKFSSLTHGSSLQKKFENEICRHLLHRKAAAEAGFVLASSSNWTPQPRQRRVALDAGATA